jgi:hypothetical protein
MGHTHQESESGYMLIGIYGMFAVGKTTFLMDAKEDLPGIVNNDLTVVFADLGDEYHYEPTDDEWIIYGDSIRWKGKRDEKLPHIESMIEDRDMLWIVESARYFGGLQDEIIRCVRKHGGGAAFIVPVSDEPTARQFLIDRCNKRNKEFRADYWTERRLNYEAYHRYVNVVNKHYLPAGIKCYVRHISYARNEWESIRELLHGMCRMDERYWYGDN